MNTKPLLDKRQEKFLQYLISGMNQRSAYRKAFRSKATDRSIDTMANRLLKNVEVELRYKDLLLKAREKAEIKEKPHVESATDLAAEIIENYKRIMRTDILDFLEWNRGKLTVRKDLKQVDTTAINEIGYDSNGRIKLKLYSKLDAMKALSDLYEITGRSDQRGIRIEIEELEDMAD